MGTLAGTCLAAAETAKQPTYPIVDTGQIRCYDDKVQVAFPQVQSPYFGQDAHYAGNQPSYQVHGNGTATDLVTGLMWQTDPGEKMTYRQAVQGASKCRTGGHSDWRLPTIKELYSLILFSGTDPDVHSTDTSRLKPFIDTQVFKFQYGNPNNGAQSERIIDSQFATSTKYVHQTMRGNDTVFGVNFADGRIKGYPMKDPRGNADKKFFVLYVRGNDHYGKNKLVDNKDGTITDHATGLTWMTVDSGMLKAGKDKDGKLNWQQALAWSESLDYAGHSDWRLPNAKELQSIVDYSRSPATTISAAIDPLFQTSRVTEGGENDYPYYWTGTTHRRGGGGRSAVYVCFGKGYGWMTDRRTGDKILMDVHGAGCQRSDPKSGDPSATPHGRGPQGDVLRIYNFVRCVRGGKANPVTTGPAVEKPDHSANPEAQQAPAAPERGITRDDRQPPAGRAGFVARLDRNKDGKVSIDEFDGPKNHFNHLDTNGDGYISQQEAPTGPPANRRPSPPHRR
ncbi:MAG: DUF1566 domain-containing protein [Akkermansiaceae bacterium]|nr:DUF1566 domain-containing protein [Akkermansiaceae bacterium]